MNDKELPKVPDRFSLKAQKLGQGTFSYIYEAYDANMRMNVALKMEKKDKSKNILKFEYQVLSHLKGLQHVPNSYEYVQNAEQNFIVMDLLGINLAKARRCLEQRYDLKIAIQILIEMVVSVKEVHKRGFIHRDVKASNFVLDRENRQVFIVDFGLAKKHLDSDNQPVPKRKNADFRGTVSFASLNAHNNIDLARRDDLWSLYFTMLDFLNEKLEWREQRDFTIVQVKDIKTKCLKSPKRKLWIGPTKGVKEVQDIMTHISSLHYADMPDYQVVINQLLLIYNNYDMVQKSVPNQNNYVWELKKRQVPHRPLLSQLDEDMKRSRTTDFQEYFNSHRSVQSTTQRQQGRMDIRMFPDAQNQHQPAPPVFEIQPGNPHIGQAPLNPDQQRGIPRQMMQQFEPFMNQPGRTDNRLPQVSQLQNGQMRQPQPNQMMLQNPQSVPGANQGHPHQMGAMQRPGPDWKPQDQPDCMDWMANFLPNPATSHLIGNPAQKQPTQAQFDQQQQQQQQPAIYGSGVNQGQQQPGGNPQMQQQPCNVQQFINIQFPQQQQQAQQQAAQQQKHNPYLNAQQQQVNQYNQIKQQQVHQQQQQSQFAGAPGMKQIPSGQGLKQQPQSQQQPASSQMQQQQQASQQLFQQQQNSNGGAPYLQQMPAQPADQRRIEEQPGMHGMQKYHQDNVIDKRRQLKRQAKGLGEIVNEPATGSQKESIKRAKYDMPGQPGATGQIYAPQHMGPMQGNNNYAGGNPEKSPVLPQQSQHEMGPHNAMFDIRNQNQQIMNQMRQQQQIMPRVGEYEQGAQLQKMPIMQSNNLGFDQNAGHQPNIEGHYNMNKQGGIAGPKMPDRDLLLKQYGQNGGGPEMYMQQNANNMGPPQQILPLPQVNQMQGGDLHGDILIPMHRKLNKRASSMFGKTVQQTPDGFYCYIPELFEKPGSQIFIITRMPRQLPGSVQPQEQQNKI